MKLLCFLILFLSFSFCHADVSIVQEIVDFQSSSITPHDQIKVHVRGNRIRIDQGQKLSSIILKDKKVTYSIMHESRQYIVLPHGKNGTNSSPPLTPDNFKIEVSGKTELLNGYLCKQLMIREKDGGVTEVMVSQEALDIKEFYKEFQGFMEFGLAGLTQHLEIHPELKGLPIRVTEFRDSKKVRQSTIVRIETTQILDSVFEVPAGYSEIKMGN